MMAEETTLRQECASLERSLTVARHDLKESQRKLDLEAEQRRKAESRVHDVEDQLQNEIALRQSAERGSQQYTDKIQLLDKQVRLNQAADTRTIIIRSASSVFHA